MSPTLELAAAIPRKLHGYDAHTIDGLVSELMASHDELLADCKELRAEVEAMQAELAGGGDLERAMRDIFVSAQREADEMRAGALREAEAIREEARRRAQGTDAWLDDEAERIRAEVARIYALEEELRADARALILEALRRLDESESEPLEAEPPTDADAVRTLVAAQTVVEPELPVAEPEPPAAEEQPEVRIEEAVTVAAAAIVIEPDLPATVVEELHAPSFPEPSLEDDTIDIPIVEADADPAATLVRPAPTLVQPAPTLVQPAPTLAKPEPLLSESAAPPAEPPIAPPVPQRAFPLRAVLVAAAILAVGAAIAILIWQLSSDDTGSEATATTPVITQTINAAPTAPVETAPETTPGSSGPADTAPAETAPAETAAASEPPPDTAAPTLATVVVRAEGGDSWLSVHRGSANGKLLFEGFVYEGESRRFKAERVWMRIGNPTNLIARLNGKPLDLPAGTADVLVTVDGAETLSLG